MKTLLVLAVFCLSTALSSGQTNSDLWAKFESDLKANPRSSLTLFRVAEIHFQRGNWQPAANTFRSALDGDLEPKWVKVWSHIYLGKIFDITHSRDRAVNEYTFAQETRDNTRGAQEEAALYLQYPYIR